MALTLFSIQNAKPMSKPYKLADGNGLHLLINPNGSKLWRLRYRFAGTQKMIGLGAFPDVPLSAARDKAHDARKLVAAGTDPSQQRKEDKIAANIAAQNTFESIAAEYLEKLKAEGAAQSTLEKNRWLLEDLAKPLSKRPAPRSRPPKFSAS